MKKRLWTYRALAEAVGSEAGLVGIDAGLGPDIFGIGIDSRQTEPGELFVALTGDPGPRFNPSSRSDRDGHNFVADAVEKGAAAVLVHLEAEYGAPALLVDDTLDALWDIGRAARTRLDAPVVAVTGSSGKTTFKSYASRALGAFATTGSLNNHIGVPLSLARTPADAPTAVYEIGTNHPGEIEPLAKLVEPDVAVLLNVHPAHIENFGTLDAVRREKVSIANGLTRSGAFVHPAGLATGFAGNRITFGTQVGSDVRLRGIANGFAEIDSPLGRLHAPVPGGGVHRAMSVCALTALLIALEMPTEYLDRLRELELPRGRGTRIDAAGVIVVDESYNANPASMAATLETFCTEPGRRFAILGDMRELGRDTERHHRELALHCAGLDGVFCVGDAVGALYDALPEALRLGFSKRADRAFAANCAARLAPGDRVLVKASNAVFWAVGFVDLLVGELAPRE